LAARSRALRAAAAWAAPLLLVGVAVAQLWLAHARGLTPWCGGAFGMFASIDSWGSRHLHATWIGDGWRQPVAVPASLRGAEQRALALPDETRLRRLAEGLAREAPPTLGPAQRVEIAVFARRFAARDLAPKGVMLRHLTLELDAE
jgi:hypothetical protein